MGTPFQEQGPNPLGAGTLQRNNLQAGPPPAAWQPLGCSVSCHCPPLASSNAVLSCQQRPTCFSAGPHQCLGSAPSRMLATCSVRCPECLRNGAMKTLSFLCPWGFCCWILSVLTAIPACSQPDREILPASSISQSSSATQFAPWDTVLFSPCTDKEAIPSLSFILRVKLLIRTDWFVQGDDLQSGTSLVPSGPTYQKSEFMLVHSFPSSGHPSRSSPGGVFLSKILLTL